MAKKYLAYYIIDSLQISGSLKKTLTESRFDLKSLLKEMIKGQSEKKSDFIIDIKEVIKDIKNLDTSQCIEFETEGPDFVCGIFEIK
jgi:hypothetical protein